MGRRAIELLLQVIDGEQPESVLMPATFVHPSDGRMRRT
jgi:DNA-binding LacI/PurR family transcriptional regulator